MKNQRVRRFGFVLALATILGLNHQMSYRLTSPQAAWKTSLSASETVTTTVSYYELGDIYQGSLDNLIDGNDETFCWFHAPTKGVSYIQLAFSESITIGDVRVLFDRTDRMIGEMSYSVDGENFTTLGTIDQNEQTLNFRDHPVEAKYLRLLETEDNGGCWVKMFDFSFNTLEGRPIVTYQGFAFIPRDWNSVDNMTDKNMDTYCWFDWKNEAGADITLTYSSIQEVQNIYLFASHPDTSDHFQRMTFYSFLDGNTYTVVGEECYLDQREVMIQLEQPLQAKYIRVVCDETQDMGFAIREFGINHVKEEAKIVFTNESFYTYTAEGQTPTYTIPYLTEAEVHYTYQSEFYSNEAPSKPGWYALVVKVKESLYYLETEKFTVFCIQDTKEHFIEQWNEAMSKGVCDYANGSGDLANYTYLLDVYNNCLTNEVKNEVSNYQWSENSTILETMEYIETLRSLSHQESASQTSFIMTSQKTDSIILLILILLLGGGIISGYYLFHKKRFLK